VNPPARGWLAGISARREGTEFRRSINASREQPVRAPALPLETFRLRTFLSLCVKKR
jgi:hypothetical protein